MRTIRDRIAAVFLVAGLVSIVIAGAVAGEKRTDEFLRVVFGWAASSAAPMSQGRK